MNSVFFDVSIVFRMYEKYDLYNKDYFERSPK